MAIRRTSHAVYDTRYHLVWAPKYRKLVLRGDFREFVKQCFQEIAVVKALRSGAINISDTMREWQREQELPQECVFCRSTSDPKVTGRPEFDTFDVNKNKIHTLIRCLSPLSANSMQFYIQGLRLLYILNFQAV